MRKFLKLTPAFGGFALMLVVASPMFAVDFWVNACCLTGGPQLKMVSVHVGTNETTNPGLWAVYGTLEVKGPNGFQCAAQNFKESIFHPMTVMPLRFQVTYPAPALKDILIPPRRHEIVRYTVTATITKVTPTSSGNFPPGDVAANNTHTVVYDLPAGGTPACAKVAGPN
jgi:hypothetical protein